jgi:hypothetical protein
VVISVSSREDGAVNLNYFEKPATINIGDDSGYFLKNVNSGSPGDRFGAGIVLQGDVMFVGAANDNNFPGFIDPAHDRADRRTV